MGDSCLSVYAAKLGLETDNIKEELIMKNNILKFGLISGSIIVGIPTLTGLIIGYGPETFKTGEIIGYSTMILSMLIIFLAAREYQNSHPQESIGFMKIFGIGAGISAIAGLMFGLYNLIYVEYIAPDFMQQYYQYYIEGIKNSGASAAEIAQQISQLESEKEMFMNPMVNFSVMFATVFLIGLVVSIISGLFQRDRNQQASLAS